MTEEDHHARIEGAPPFDGNEGKYELKEYKYGQKVGVVGPFNTEQEAREFHNENFDFPLRN